MITLKIRKNRPGFRSHVAGACPTGLHGIGPSIIAFHNADMTVKKGHKNK